MKYHALFGFFFYFFQVNNEIFVSPQNTSCQSSLEEVTAKRELLTQKEDMIHCLQAELVKVRLREAENEVLIRDLRDRIQELEEVKFHFHSFTYK